MLHAVPFYAALPCLRVAVFAISSDHNRFLRKVRGSRYRICPDCGYSLSGLPDRHACPECGLRYTVEELEQRWRPWQYPMIEWPRNIRRSDDVGR